MFVGYQNSVSSQALRVEFLLKNDSGYPKDAGVATSWQKLWFGHTKNVACSSLSTQRVAICSVCCGVLQCQKDERFCC